MCECESVISCRQVAIRGLARALCMGEFLDAAAADPAASVRRQSAVRHSSSSAPQSDGGTMDHTAAAGRRSCSRRQSRSSTTRSPYYQKYQEPPPPPSTVVTDDYAASVASRVIQPPIIDFRETNGAGGSATGGLLPDRNRQNAAEALVASIERCSEPFQDGRGLQTDIREIRRIIRAYVGRLQDREITNHVAREWRIVARVLDRLFFMLYIGTIMVSLATMFPKDLEKDDIEDAVTSPAG